MKDRFFLEDKLKLSKAEMFSKVWERLRRSSVEKGEEETRKVVSRSRQGFDDLKWKIGDINK